MASSSPHARQPGWTRFGLGAFTCTVISDGRLELERPPRGVFVGHRGSEVDDLLAADFLAPDGRHLDQNLLVVDTGEHRVLFDAGSGNELGVSAFGPGVGRARANMLASGLAPESIDVVALTHLHPDHCWGLVEGGEATFPNAVVGVPDEDLKHVEELEARLTSPDMDPAVRGAVIGARRSLAPYEAAGRLRRLAQGEQVVPGVTAHAAPGHSRGHMTYRVESEGHVLVVLGDIAHHHVLHLVHPEWSTIYDDDKDTVVSTRTRVFREIVEARAAVHAFHFPFPGLGHLQERHKAFRWLPSPLELAEPPR